MSTVGDLRAILEGKEDGQEISMQITGLNIVVLDLPIKEADTVGESKDGEDIEKDASVDTEASQEPTEASEEVVG